MLQQPEYVTIEEGLDFLLSHFTEPLWPRNVATAATNTKQHTVEDRDRALLYYKAARLEDCRLSIFPNYERMAEMGYQNLGPSHIPDMILIDIDLETFKQDTDQFNTAVKTTLRNIKKHLNGVQPTVIFTGSGVHILQPLLLNQAFEDMPEFNKFRKNSTDVSVRFMRWAARRLSSGRSDPKHNPSFASCLTRIPGSKNGKNGETVKILQHWNGVRAKVPKQFITDFLIDLVQSEIGKNLRMQEISKKFNNLRTQKTEHTNWIEKLIGTPIADGRKNIMALVLVPYLIVRRGLSPSQTHDTVMDWADKCDKLRPLQPSHSAYASRVKSRIQEVAQHRIPPMTFSKFKEMHPQIAAELIS
jgi:hypothetical protein